MRCVCVIALVLACGSTGPTPSVPNAPNAELSTALAPLHGWLGAWEPEGDATSTTHWVASSGVVFGIVLQDRAGFLVDIVDDGEGSGSADGKLRLFSMPGGMTQHELSQRAGTTIFEGPGQTVTIARDGEALTTTVVGTGKSATFRYKRTTAERAPALEAADVAFAQDTAARGIEGWVAAFDPAGAMMTKGGRVEGVAAIREVMSELLATTKVEWAPIASAVRGDVGFTVGKATFTAKDGGWKSTYVTIWKQQPDGSWKVLFDTGRTVQAQ